MINRLPLQAKGVLITRGGAQGKRIGTEIKNQGGIPYIVPLIRFRSYHDPSAQTYFQQIDEYDWIIFTSKNGVKYFFEQLSIHSPHIQPQMLENRFAVVGEKTKEFLEKYGVKSKFMPSLYTAEDFSQEFFVEGYASNKILIAKGNLASKTIANAFRDRNFIADEMIVYETYFPGESEGEIVELIHKEYLDLLTFTSPSTFQHFYEIIRKNHLIEQAKNIKIACIGPVTKKKIEKHGFSVDICPQTYTIAAMLAEIIATYHQP